MTEKELVSAALVELAVRKENVSTATIIDTLEGGEYFIAQQRNHCVFSIGGYYQHH